MCPAWASTRSSFRVPCTAWRRICTRHLSRLRAQAQADPVSAAVEGAVEVFLAAVLVAAAEARSKRKKGPLASEPPQSSPKILISLRPTHCYPTAHCCPRAHSIPRGHYFPTTHCFPIMHCCPKVRSSPRVHCCPTTHWSRTGWTPVLPS